jgi:hypothetical protein
MITLRIAALVLGTGVLLSCFREILDAILLSPSSLAFRSASASSQRARDATGILCSDAELMHRLPTGGGPQQTGDEARTGRPARSWAAHNSVHGPVPDKNQARDRPPFDARRPSLHLNVALYCWPQTQLSENEKCAAFASTPRKLKLSGLCSPSA